MSLGANVNAELLKNKALRDAKNAAAVPQEPQRSQNIDTQATTVVQPTAQPEPAAPAQTATQAVPVQQPAAPAQASAPATTEIPAAEPPKPTTQIDLEEPKFEWDQPATPPAEVLKPAVTPDFKKISSALKFETEITSEDDLVARVSERFSQLGSALDGVPEPLKQAVELAKKGGDWVAFTDAAALDVSKLDPATIFDRQYERDNAYRFKNPDGTFDAKSFDDELNSIAHGVKVMNGNQIKHGLIVQQQTRQNQLLAEVARRSEAFQKNLGEAARDLATLLPQEKYGVPIEPGNAAFFYNGINDGSLIRKHLGDIDPGVLSRLDAKKLMKTLAIAELGEKVSKFRYEKGVVAGKKELLSSTQNAQITTTSTPPAPSSPEAPKAPTSTEKLKKFHESAKPPNSL